MHQIIINLLYSVITWEGDLHVHYVGSYDTNAECKREGYRLVDETLIGLGYTVKPETIIIRCELALGRDV